MSHVHPFSGRSRRLLRATALMWILAAPWKGLSQEATVEQVIDQINTDSLLRSVAILTGEQPAVIGDRAETIVSRRYYLPTNDLAADWISSRLESHGLEVFDQVSQDTARNIIGVQPGTVVGAPVIIVGAHYDAVGDTAYVVPGADDNASGTAGVLELARVLSGVSLPTPVWYCLWDAEEIGLYGSSLQARLARQNGESIAAVINLDMIGWDSDLDGRIEVHSDSASHALAQLVASLPVRHGIPLDPQVIQPGTNRSDHASFWRYGYPAVLLIEAFFSGDRNPNYHKPADTLGALNPAFFRAATQLAAASLVTVAREYETLANRADETPDPRTAFRVDPPYPHPVSGRATIEIQLPDASAVRLEVFDAFGRTVRATPETLLVGGRHQIPIDLDGLAPGLYAYRVRAAHAARTGTMIVR